MHRVFFSHKIVSTGAYDLLHRVFRTPGFAYTPPELPGSAHAVLQLRVDEIGIDALERAFEVFVPPVVVAIAMDLKCAFSLGLIILTVPCVIVELVLDVDDHRVDRIPAVVVGDV